MVKSVFVSIASYRDISLTSTVRSFLGRASNQERVHLGILAQNDLSCEEEGLCLSQDERSKWGRQIQYQAVPFTEARGPLWARQKILENMYNEEDIYLQVDSHTAMVRDWDIALESQLLRSGEKGVVTYYPLSITSTPTDQIPQMIRAEPYFRHRGVLKFKAVLRDPPPPAPAPLWETRYLAAGFLAGKGRDILRAYPRVHIPFLFQGEEMLLWSYFRRTGLRFFAPSVHLAFHSYGRHDEPKIWRDLANEWCRYEPLALETVVREVNH